MPGSASSGAIRKPRDLAVLIEVAAWREREAQIEERAALAASSRTTPSPKSRCRRPTRRSSSAASA